MAKATKKKALGRGLSALLQDPENDIQSASDENADKVVGSIVELDLKNIDVNPFQPRTDFNEESLKQLASSIRELGVIQPITVRKMNFNKFQLVSGERRFRASKLAGLKTIPAFIRIANDRESLEMALVENIQRRDLDPIEIALSYERLLKEIDLTQSQLSSRIGKNRSTIANYLRLLKLDPIIQTGMRDGFLSMGHGRCLISLENTDAQIKVYETVVAENLSVRETEELVRNKESKTKKSTKKTSPLPKPVLKTKKDFAEFFGAKVDVKMSKKGNGRFVIPFSSEEDMERLAKLINGES